MTNHAWLDAHLDLAYLAGEGRDFHHSVAELGIDGAVTWPDLAAARIQTLFATIFTDRDGPAGEPAAYPADDPDAAERAGRRQLSWYEAEEAAGRVTIVRDLADLDAEIVPRLVLLMECADPIKTPDDVAWWVDRGLRVVGLSWARGSRYAGTSPYDPCLPPWVPGGRFEKKGVMEDSPYIGELLTAIFYLVVVHIDLYYWRS